MENEVKVKKEIKEIREYVNISDSVLYFDGDRVMAGEIIKVNPDKSPIIKTLIDRKIIKELNSKTFSK